MSKESQQPSLPRSKNETEGSRVRQSGTIASKGRSTTKEPTTVDMQDDIALLPSEMPTEELVPEADAPAEEESFPEEEGVTTYSYPSLMSRRYRVTLRSKQRHKSFLQQLMDTKNVAYFIVFFLSIVAFNACKYYMEGTPNMGNQSTAEVTRDYLGFFLITFLFARYLSLPSLVLLWSTMAAFHVLFNIHYYDESRPGLHGQHLQYFCMVYLISLGIIMSMKKMIPAHKRRSQLIY